MTFLLLSVLFTDPSSSLELEHSLNITPSINGTVLAGTTLTLTCVAVVGRVPTLKWIGPNGEPVTSGNGIVVSQQDNIVNLTFNGVRTSQAGNYSCSSELQQPYSLAEDQYCLEVKSKHRLKSTFEVLGHFICINFFCCYVIGSLFATDKAQQLTHLMRVLHGPAFQCKCT